MARRKYVHGTHTTSKDLASVFKGVPEDAPPAGAGAGYESPATARQAVRRLNTPYDVNESYFDHPLSPGSKVGHDQARHSHQKLLGEEWRAERDATNPISGSDTRVDEWRAKVRRDPATAPDPVRAQTGCLCLCGRASLARCDLTARVVWVSAFRLATCLQGHFETMRCTGILS